MASFVAHATPPAGARARAATAVMDTIGVALAGVAEPAARIVRETLCDPGRYPGSKDPGLHRSERPGPDEAPNGAPGRPSNGAPGLPPSREASADRRSLGGGGQTRGISVWGTGLRAAAADAALANGTAAHALDYDDMCFVSLAHPSAPLVPAVVAVGELMGASGRAVLDAYVVGFEIQARLGRLMNPRHYQRGWHCTSTLGAMSAAAGAARLLGLDAATASHALAIAASSASGLKENFGSMVKPLHAGLAARDGVLAARFAKGGLTGSANAIDGPQGFLHAFDSERADLAAEIGDLGRRWEILDTGITVKLYPSCAGTHPTLDALLDLLAQHHFTAAEVERIEIDVDPIVPTILLYARPASALEAKFSMPFCAAAAVVFGRVSIDTFDDERIRDARVQSLMTRVTMRVDDAIGRGKPALTEARVHVTVRDGRTLVKDAHGARGYPVNPASAAELSAKFSACAEPAIGEGHTTRAMSMLNAVDELSNIQQLAEVIGAGPTT